MNIVHVTSHLNIGGVSSYVSALSRGFKDRGHRVLVVSGGGELVSRLTAEGIEHWQAPLHTKAEFSLQVWRAKQELLQKFRRERVDLLHAHTRVGQVVAAWLAEQLHVPYVATWHGIFRRNLGRLLWPCTGDLTIAISHPVRQHLIEHFHVPENRIRLVHNGVDTRYFAVRPEAPALQAYRTQWNILEGRPTIGGIGRFASGRVKGFDLFLEAAQRLSKEFPDLQVVLVGDGPRRTFIEAKAKEFGIYHLVRFVGTTTDTRVPLALMDVFAFTSRWPEGFGLSLVEAMAAGRPVAATRVGATPEIVEHGRSGLLAAPEDPEKIAENIAQLLRKPSLAAELARAGQERVVEHFSLDRLVGDVAAVYSELVV